MRLTAFFAARRDIVLAEQAATYKGRRLVTAPQSGCSKKNCPSACTEPEWKRWAGETTSTQPRHVAADQVIPEGDIVQVPHIFQGF